MAADIVVSAAIETSGAAAGARQFNSALGTMRGAVAQAGRSVSELSRSVFSLRGALAGFSAAVGVREVLQAGDAYSNLKARLQLVAQEGETAAGTFEGLNDAAARARAPVSTLTEVYTRNAAALAQMGRTTGEGIRLAETLAKVTVISGASAQQASAGMMQLSQAIASGRFQGDEFRSVAENLPEIMRILQRETGKTAGELRKLASEGKLTADVLVNALSNAATDVDSKFAQMPQTVESAWTRLSDVFTQNVGKAMEAEGATKSWVAALNEATKWMQSGDGISVFQTLASAVGAIGDGFANVARAARVMAEETRIAAAEAKANEGVFTKLGNALWSIGRDAAGAVGAAGRAAITGANGRQRALAEQSILYQDSGARGALMEGIDSPKIEAATPSAKLPIKFGTGEATEQEIKRTAKLREELQKNIEVEKLRSSITRAEIEGNGALAQTLRSQLEIRSRISDDMRKANPEAAKALEREIELQNQLQIQLENTQAIQDRNNEFARDFASTISQGFANAVTSGKSLIDTLKEIGVKLVDVALQAAVFKPLEQGLSAAIGGGLNGGGFNIGSLFSGGPTLSGWTPTVTTFANGGVLNSPARFMSGGMSGVAGEAGPESILPLRRGPDGKLGVSASGAGGGSYVLNFNVAGDATDATLAKMERVFDEKMSRFAPGLIKQSTAAVRREIVADRHFLRRG